MRYSRELFRVCDAAAYGRIVLSLSSITAVQNELFHLFHTEKIKITISHRNDDIWEFKGKGETQWTLVGSIFGQQQTDAFSYY